MRGLRALVAGVFVVGMLTLPTAIIAAGGPAPGENCVPGTVWEDLSSGVKYICIYDELYGGSRWELLSGGQRGARAWLYRSSIQGCLFGTVGLTTLGGDSGADSIVRGYRWPCSSIRDRRAQPPGELRSRIVIQAFNGGWTTCRDSGFSYNTVAAHGWLAGIGMGISPDCGAGTYRAIGFGTFFESSGWRGSSVVSPPLWLP
jgi:hypothetical protein